MKKPAKHRPTSKYFKIVSSHGKIVFTHVAKQWLKSNYHKFSNKEIAKHFGLRITRLRGLLYEAGYQRMFLEYWTEEQIKFLKANYKFIGDLELAEMFEERWPKQKKWTKKHIEKKRNYLNLKRTRKQLIDITQRNLDQGRLNTHMHKGKSNFLTTGPAKQKEIRFYRTTYGTIQARIKIGRRWIQWQRWIYEKKVGPIPKGMVVTRKIGVDPFNTNWKNLELITRAESTRRHAAQGAIDLTDGYIIGMLGYRNKELRNYLKQFPELIRMKRQQLLLNRKIKQK